MELLDRVENLDYITPLLIVVEMIGLACIYLIFHWCILFGGDFGLSGKALFQWHPLFMTIGMVYLLGNGILIFRIFQSCGKYTLKLMHVAVNAIGLLFTLVATITVIISHKQTRKPYSLHSWLGYIVITIYAIQALVSVFFFLLDRVSYATKASLLPFHVFFGHAIFILGIGSAITGLNEKAFGSMKETYLRLPTEAIVINSTGILMTVFGALIVYMATNPNYRWCPRAENVYLLQRCDE